ncbi:biliverdin-producing heme oxygenase [Rhodococcus sp. KBS0724]|uniref:biliverdin-producing heme oxygenase n=1 Tax=Rhodococcus sp. KBS0724 TaxID=1179674 RepID=UPI00110DB61E|nr:biliverdin-producing heme oxygenase [Rhodococcus sp. KBS0724]TSD47591.1 biliverdin-producing heme oxygenase [Rhodococcus sp. KBS0724]
MTTLDVDHSPADASAFSERIKAQTDAAHRETEQSRFVGALLGGELTTAGYAALLGQTYLVYTSLEEAGRAHADNALVNPFLSDDLLRVAALEADLEFLNGPNWREGLEALPATQRYVARLQEVAFDWPAGFVAHHYLRYMGDLSGGQIIRRMLERAYGFETDGLRFYIFDGIPKPKPFKDAYRANLDALAISPDDQQKFIDEVNLAYRLNGDLFADLEGDIESYLVK